MKMELIAWLIMLEAATVSKSEHTRIAYLFVHIPSISVEFN